MVKSMTGFGAAEGSSGQLNWRWEVRSVNGRGLDLRYRGPEGRENVENSIKAEARKRFARGNISINLRVSREEGAMQLQIDEAVMERLLAAAKMVEAAAIQTGMNVAPLSVEALLAQRGLLVMQEDEISADEQKRDEAAMIADGMAALDDLAASRASEGSKMADVLNRQIIEIENLQAEALQAVEAREASRGPQLSARVEAVMRAAGAGAPDADRLAQELAIIAVKADVREELDRLVAHIAAARELLASGEPVGRKLDFLTQEFNREANTICSKADYAQLTKAGLALKTVIDQLREQVQNVE